MQRENAEKSTKSSSPEIGIVGILIRIAFYYMMPL